jgi:Cu2+-exporting ATPase
MSVCFHCNEPIPKNLQIFARIGPRDEPVCCHGCRAVAELIVGAGLQDYYRFRDAPAHRSEEAADSGRWLAYDQPELLAQFTRSENDGARSTTLVLDGIGCAACGWLIDRMLKRECGVCAVNVNVATARVYVRWQSNAIAFSRLLQCLDSLGYRPHVAISRGADRSRDERRAALKRLAVAGFGMMQVMMLAVAFYVGGVEANVLTYFRYISLLCSTPVLFYAGWPFLINAWRAIRVRAITMDVPVTIGLVLAYGASLWNTVSGKGEVYFDSVTMFVFFLAIGRFVEMTARHRTADVTDALARLLPETAHRIQTKDGNRIIEDVAVASLACGDEVIVRRGETIPADGCVLEGASRVDEALLTGESQPVARGIGSALAAGTMNLHAPLHMRVTAVGDATTLSGIMRLLEKAGHDRAPQISEADRAASWFLSRILVAAGIVAAVWLFINPSRAFEATLAVLVVTCPCALSLAAPTARAAATAALARRGVLVSKSSALENLAGITRVVFDKTGTLTHGQPILERCEPNGDCSERDCRRIAFALEQASEHPIASAFWLDDESMIARDVRILPGGGLEGTVSGTRYRIGQRQFVAELRGEKGQADHASVFLGDSTRELASFCLGDRLRTDARETVAALRRRGLPSEILSGDAWVAVANTAAACGIEYYAARQSPTGKLEHVRELAAHGERIAMIGDGINDAPVLQGAAVSIAMGRGSALAQASADIVLVGDRLSALPWAIDIAQRTQRVVKQNLTWAAAYNLIALPLAAFGFVPPWLAAVGMSASSIVVVLNALRLCPRSRTVSARDREIVRSTEQEPFISRTHDLSPSRSP